ncbi:MAG: Rha family transcriptional regulator, partial [Nitrospirae bacterium]|nr:Rha family transcriptional regulator [Nitrospirota bacterium]
MNAQNNLPAVRQPKKFRLTQEVIVYQEKGKAFTTSLIVADKFGKRHADVIRSIEKTECSEEFSQRNFALSEYTDSTGRILPMYNITRAGCMKLIMGLTGKEAVRWQEMFINAFNRMERLLRQPAINKADLQTAIARQKAIENRKNETECL